MHSCINQHSSLFPTSFAATNISVLFKNLKAIWPVSCVLQKYETIERTSASNEICPFYADTEIASQLLSVPKNEIHTLVESGLIKPKGSKKLNYKSIIDISPVIELLAPHFTSSEMKPLSEQKESLLYYNICLSEIFLAVNNSELTVGYQPGNDLMSSIYCIPENLKAFADKHHKTESQSYITLDKAVKLTGCSLKQLEQLRLHGKLRSPNWVKAKREKLFIYDDVLAIREQIETNQLGFDF